MRKIGLVIKREYLTRVRSKAFIFTTILLPVFSIGILVVTIALATRRTDRTQHIAILDQSNGLAKDITANLKDKLKNGQPLVTVVRTLEQPAEASKVKAELVAQVRAEQLDGYLVLPKDATTGKPPEFHTRNPGDFEVAGSIRHAVSDAIIARRLSDRGVHLANVSEIVRGVDVTLMKVTKAGEAEESGQSFLVGLSVIMVLYITLIVYGVATMRSVLEEKTTRVVEILVSSARAQDLLTGKILGVAGVGLTQYLIWGLLAALISAYGGAMAAAFRPGASLPKLSIPPSLLIYAILFFLAGYFLYASLYAAVGAMVSSEEESQQVQLPITMIVVVAFLLYPAVMKDPNSHLSIIVSMIPFLSPILMVLRITLQTPPFWQIALSLALVVLTTLVIVQFSSKIYRVGILMYGKRPSLVELLRWLRYT